MVIKGPKKKTAKHYHCCFLNGTLCFKDFTEKIKDFLKLLTKLQLGTHSPEATV